MVVYYNKIFKYLWDSKHTSFFYQIIIVIFTSDLHGPTISNQLNIFLLNFHFKYISQIKHEAI